MRKLRRFYFPKLFCIGFKKNLDKDILQNYLLPIVFTVKFSFCVFFTNKEDIDVLIYDFAKLKEHIIADRIPI